MKTYNLPLRGTAALLISTVLSSCLTSFSPTLFVSLAKYAVDDGSDVTFSITYANNPTSVTCFNGNVIMTTTGDGIYTGTADYTNDLLVRPGTNPVICRASNSSGSSSSTVGFIELIPNVAPTIVMLPTVCIPNNNGSLAFNTVLINSASTTNVMGAAYTLTGGILPAGLVINSNSGHLTGTAASGDFNPSGLKITATTLAGATESAAFDIDINLSTCP